MAARRPGFRERLHRARRKLPDLGYQRVARQRRPGLATQPGGERGAGRLRIVPAGAGRDRHQRGGADTAPHAVLARGGVRQRAPSDFRTDAQRTLFDDFDCSSFDPRDCGTPVQISTSAICTVEAQGTLEPMLAQARRFDVLRGALLVSFAGGGGVRILSGKRLVTVHPNTGPEDESEARRPRPVVQAMRRYGDPAPMALAPPRVPQRFARALRRVAAADAVLHDVRAVARHLGLRRSRVRDRLRIAAALKRFGPLRTVSCPRPPGAG